jgi:hypothetical protein
MMSSAFGRHFFSRHPIISIFWIPPFALVFLLAFAFITFSPRIQDAAHTIPFSSCQKITGICKIYYITPFEHLLYLGMFTLAIPSFLIFWVVGFIESIRWTAAKKR